MFGRINSMKRRNFLKRTGQVCIGGSVASFIPQLHAENVKADEEENVDNCEAEIAIAMALWKYCPLRSLAYNNPKYQTHLITEESKEEFCYHFTIFKDYKKIGIKKVETKRIVEYIKQHDGFCPLVCFDNLDVAKEFVMENRIFVLMNYFVSHKEYNQYIYNGISYAEKINGEYS